MATVGADPELAIRDAGGQTVVSAQRFFPHMEGQEFPWGRVGRDGAGGPLEIRPKPSFSPAEVVRNIGMLFGAAFGIIPRTHHLAVGSEAPVIGSIGGHLHSWGRGETRKKLYDAHNRGRVCIGLTLLWALEDPAIGARRRVRGYGGVNDVRRGQPTYEFRSPSSDWLASPGLACSTLYYFQHLVDNLDKYGRDVDELDEILRCAMDYWNRNSSQRGDYIDRVVNLVKPAVRPGDINTILFFANKLSGWRDTLGLINLDVEKWRRKAGCLD